MWSRNSEWRRITRVIRRLAAAALAFAAVAAPSAHAAPTCKNIAVTALAFGNYDVYNAVPADSNPLTPTVTIDAGLAFSGGRRRMTGTPATDWLSYDIFVDAARTVVWASTPVAVPAGINRTVSYYARVFAQQDASVGSYSDTLVVTFNF
ncbi:MAG: spore coat protein U domain-containing protein [Deltaproteobacteria bacterium]|nr:MAG: spore coat protein U domain-containing protein [Deltaproteobacteria bacterium]